MAKLVTPRPFVKWVGGKTQLVNELLKRTPPFFKKYYEPFVGGGAFFFALHRDRGIKRAHLADLNLELMDTYKAIRDDVVKLVELLAGYPHDKNFFYEIRAQNPENMTPIERAARMIYLNKTCYNGLYRVNRKGQFNVPFGSYKSPKICDEKNLLAVSKTLRNVEFECAVFDDILKKVQKDDLVYFDPPYEPISKTANFTSYQQGGFTQDSQERLRDVCHKLTRRKVKFILSNSSANLIRELYGSNGFHVNEVLATRSINSNPQKRGKLTELIVTNYLPEDA